MKKVFSIAAVALFVVSFSSCTGDFTCDCTYEVLGQSTDISYDYEGVKKADAEESCDAAAAALGSTGDCELK